MLRCLLKHLLSCEFPRDFVSSLSTLFLYLVVACASKDYNCRCPSHTEPLIMTATNMTQDLTHIEAVVLDIGMLSTACFAFS